MMTPLFLLTIFLLHYGPVYAGWLAVEKQYQPIGLETCISTRKRFTKTGFA